MNFAKQALKWDFSYFGIFKEKFVILFPKNKYELKAWTNSCKSGKESI